MDVKQLYKLYTKNGYKVTTDSRSVEPGAIFFALKGQHFDGNAFAHQALEKGASFAVIDNPQYLIPGKTILVDSALNVLQQLAKYHRQQLNIPLIAITGTAGKTTTKELIRSVLSQKFKTFATTGNLNNHIGVPLSMLKITPDTEIAVIEMGASYPGDIRLLCDIALPDYGLITNIGTAHIQGFGSRENLIKTKTELYRHIENHGKLIFVNADDPLLISLIHQTETFTYGTKDQAHVRGNWLDLNPFLKAKFWWQGQEYLVQTKLFGLYNLYNLLAAAAIGLYFGVSPDKVVIGLESYEPKNNRSQLHQTDKNTLILDLYNANPTSMSKALESFAKLQSTKPKVLILGDMLELGNIAQQEHNKILQLAENLGFNNIFLIGQIFSSLNSKYKTFADTNQLKQYLQKHPLTDKFILLKGSRGIQLEKLLDVL